MNQQIQGGRRFRGRVLPLPPQHARLPSLPSRVLVATALLPVLVAGGHASVGRIPPRAHTQVRAVAVVVGSSASRVPRSAIVLRAPAHVAVRTRPVPSAFVFHGRVDVARGSAAILRIPVRQTILTHPMIVLPTSVALANDGVTGVILVGS